MNQDKIWLQLRRIFIHYISLPEYWYKMEKQDDTLKPVTENGNVAASSGEYNITY